MPAKFSSSNGSSSIAEPHILMEISNILNTGLDRPSLSLLVRMLEQGVHPEALARVVLELDRELRNVKAKEDAGSKTCRRDL
ncbi:hypothetical protein cyc_02712 [Cyclospora cayetanensis]|uniref:Mitotic-spindle organizing protein 1 n=1 Tax=Cyclospora cayetanensis TaxID=88456 RepID=A0A1D3CVM9_9EIME|nr:hypothetical protein cyc_02712 [Cyclospora cayetanensis]